MIKFHILWTLYILYTFILNLIYLLINIPLSFLIYMVNYNILLTYTIFFDIVLTFFFFKNILSSIIYIYTRYTIIKLNILFERLWNYQLDLNCDYSILEEIYRLFMITKRYLRAKQRSKSILFIECMK